MPTLSLPASRPPPLPPAHAQPHTHGRAAAEEASVRLRGVAPSRGLGPSERRSQTHLCPPAVCARVERSSASLRRSNRPRCPHLTSPYLTFPYLTRCPVSPRLAALRGAKPRHAPASRTHPSTPPHPFPRRCARPTPLPLPRRLVQPLPCPSARPSQTARQAHALLRRLRRARRQASRRVGERPPPAQAAGVHRLGGGAERRRADRE